MSKKALLCYICATDLESAHVCFLAGGLVSGSSEESGLFDTVGLLLVSILLSSFNPFPNFSIEVPCLSPMFVCKDLHLSQSAAGRASQRTDMLGSYLRAQHGISNSVRDWSL